MSYSPKPGDLLLCYPGSLIQDGIAAVEAIELLRQGRHPPAGLHIYSHVAVYVGDGQVIEALGRGLVKSPADGYRGCADVWSYPMISDGGRRRITRTAETMCAEGYRYSYWDIFVLLVRLITGVPIPWKQKRSLVCSVFGYDVWWAAGLKIASYRNCCPEEICTYGVLEYIGPYV